MIDQIANLFGWIAASLVMVVFGLMCARACVAIAIAIDHQIDHAWSRYKGRLYCSQRCLLQEVHVDQYRRVPR